MATSNNTVTDVSIVNAVGEHNALATEDDELLRDLERLGEAMGRPHKRLIIVHGTEATVEAAKKFGETLLISGDTWNGHANGVVYGPLYTIRDGRIRATKLQARLETADEVHRVTSQCDDCENAAAVLVYQEEHLCISCANDATQRPPPTLPLFGSIELDENKITISLKAPPIAHSVRRNILCDAVVDCILALDNQVDLPSKRQYNLTAPRTLKDTDLEDVDRLLREKRPSVSVVWK
jgi:hypothetical protein